jgi:hypothetical protein
MGECNSHHAYCVLSQTSAATDCESVGYKPKASATLARHPLFYMQRRQHVQS